MLFSGGLGWTLLAGELAAAESPWDVLGDLPRDYTIAQRGRPALGERDHHAADPAAVAAAGPAAVRHDRTWWWRAAVEETDEPRRMRLLAGAGVVAGLLPLSHAHSFRWRSRWGAAGPALPARADLTARLRTGRLLRPCAGAGGPPDRLERAGERAEDDGRSWDGTSAGTGATSIPPGSGSTTRAVHPAARGGARTATGGWLPPGCWRYYLPFTLCFLVPNVLRLSPWIWDNIKFLFYWYVASAPLVAVVLARMARGPLAARLAAPLVLHRARASPAPSTSGGWPAGRIAHVVFDAEAIAFGRDIARTTPPGAVIAAWPAYDSPVLLSGRPGLIGYPGHIWSQGLDAGTRVQDLESFYAGTLSAAELQVPLWCGVRRSSALKPGC